jgi:hypothetical protein
VLCVGHLGALALVGGYGLGKYRFDAESRGLLLGHHHVFADPGHRTRDWLADTGGIDYERGALVFAAGLIVVAALYFWTSASRVTLFWVAFILTRPLGATVGDFLDKPVSNGGLDVSRPLASAVIAALIVAAIIVLPRRAGRHPGEKEGRTAVGAESVGVDDPQPTDGVLPNQGAPMGGGGGLRANGHTMWSNPTTTGNRSLAWRHGEPT